MQSKKTEQQVLHQEIALDSYLKTLLEEIPDEVGLNQVEVEAKVVKTSPVKVKIAKKTQSFEILDKANQNPNDKNLAGFYKTTELSDKLSNPISVMPDWAHNEFQALLFKVDKLTLAAPLTSLLRTIKIEKKPTPIPGQPSWFLGLLDANEHRIGVLDMGQLVFGKKKGQQRDLKKQPFQSILITSDGKWGLACDEILSISTLEPEKVRWRTLRQKRPWLLGTVIEELTAVIEVNKLVPHHKERKNIS